MARHINFLPIIALLFPSIMFGLTLKHHLPEQIFSLIEPYTIDQNLRDHVIVINRYFQQLPIIRSEIIKENRVVYPADQDGQSEFSIAIHRWRLGNKISERVNYLVGGRHSGHVDFIRSGESLNDTPDFALRQGDFPLPEKEDSYELSSRLLGFKILVTQRTVKAGTHRELLFSFGDQLITYNIREIIQPDLVTIHMAPFTSKGSIRLQPFIKIQKSMGEWHPPQFQLSPAGQITTPSQFSKTSHWVMYPFWNYQCLFYLIFYEDWPMPNGSYCIALDTKFISYLIEH